ncbi:MAG: response regulator, partial [Desulfovibrio sp.]|nr:response regulator [Desulfovibrio sp.]
LPEEHMPQDYPDTGLQELPHIVIIDDSKLKQLFLSEILKSEFAVFAFASEREALPRLPDIRPECILLDMERPGEDGFQTINHIKSLPVTAGVPLILITSTDDGETERRALEHGVVDFVGNRYAPAVIRNRVKNQVELYGYRRELERRVNLKTRSVLELQDAIMFMLSDLVECRDSLTSGHARRTRDYMERLIRQIIADGSYVEALTPELVRDIVRAAPLHDIGKVGIQDAVLNKPGRLTADEFNDMKRHTILGASAIAHAMKTLHENAFLCVLRDVVFSHHERWDGTGYPLGLSGQSIPLSGRIMAIPDVYDALVSKRPYKEPFSHEKAVRIIREGIGTHFDPLVGEAFLRCEQDFARIAQEQR